MYPTFHTISAQRVAPGMAPHGPRRGTPRRNFEKNDKEKITYMYRAKVLLRGVGGTARNSAMAEHWTRYHCGKDRVLTTRFWPR